MYNNLIAFDLDGVIINIFPEFRKLFLKYFHHDIVPQKKFDFNIPKKIANQLEVKRLWQSHLKEMTYNSNLIQGSLEINRFQKYGKLIFITARPEGTQGYLREYLNGKLGHDNFEIVIDNSRSKLDSIKKYNLNYFVDDRFRTCLEIAPYVGKVLLFDRMWNQRRESRIKNIKRVYTMDDVINHINNDNMININRKYCEFI